MTDLVRPVPDGRGRWFVPVRTLHRQIVDELGVSKMLETHPLGRIGSPEEIAEVICFPTARQSRLSPARTGRSTAASGPRFA